MAISKREFDAVAIVANWIDAYKERRADDLLALYDKTATFECGCDGAFATGHAELDRFWRPKLAAAASTPFRINALIPGGEGVAVDYQNDDGTLVHMFFRFNNAGKIQHMSCDPSNGASA